MKQKHRSWTATALGLMTTLYSSLVVVDLDKLDYSLPSTYMKLVGVALPAIVGYFSEVKGKEKAPD